MMLYSRFSLHKHLVSLIAKTPVLGVLFHVSACHEQEPGVHKSVKSNRLVRLIEQEFLLHSFDIKSNTPQLNTLLRTRKKNLKCC